MAVMQVNLPERKNPLSSFMNAAQIGQMGYQGYQLLPNGAGAAGAQSSSMSFVPSGGAEGFKLGIGSGGTPAAAGSEAGTETSISLSTPSQAGVYGAEYAPPVAAGLVGAFQAKSNYDYQNKGSKAGNAPYATKEGPALSWGSDSISRRMEATKMLDPMRLKEQLKTIEGLDLPRKDKDSMLGKISDALNLIKTIKIG